MGEKQTETVLKLLEKYKDALLDEASEPKLIPDSTYLYNLACQLSKVVPLNHGKVDIIHCRWAEALRDAYYLGCITEQKDKNPEYGNFAPIQELMRDTINTAFEMGKEYAPQREKRTH
jgi:hypothetical protein